MLIDNEEAWLEARRTCITATKIAGILGIHPYETMRTIYEEMLGYREKETSEAMETGIAMEPYIAAHYAKKNGLDFGTDVVKLDFATHPNNPRFGATGDYLITSTDTLLECKWVGVNAARNFGPDDSDEIPAHYLLQCQWQMYVYGKPKAIVHALNGFGRWKTHPVKADKELHRRMAHHAAKFLGEYIDGDCPPPISGQQPDTDLLKEKFPASDGQLIAAPYELKETVAELGHKVVAMRDHELEIERLKNVLKEHMGEAAAMKSDEGTFTWKNNKDSVKTNWRTVTESLICYAKVMIQDPEVLDLFIREAVRLTNEFTETKPGPRVFRMPWRSDRA